MDGMMKISDLLKDEEKMKAKVANCLKTLDRDKSGYLEEAELVKFVKMMNVYLSEELEVAEVNVADFIKEFDKDGNGKIDVHELMAFYKGFWADKLE